VIDMLMIDMLMEDEARSEHPMCRHRALAKAQPDLASFGKELEQPGGRLVGRRMEDPPRWRRVCI
jgi:hypothetical protein